MTCNGVPSSFFPSNFLWQQQQQQQQQQQHEALLPSPPCPNTHDFRGMATVLGKRSMSFPGIMDGCEDMMNPDDELSDDGYQPGEKKRRLNLEQVRTLEKSFEMGSRLEPERKMQLARSLGLQPRQIAIWFQNRRARWKTKQLEKDYDELKRQYEGVKSENDLLQSQNKKLLAEISALKVRGASEPINLNKETEASCSNRSENSSEINLDISRTAAPTVDSSTPNVGQSRPLFSPLRPVGSTGQLLQTNKTDTARCPKMENTIQDENFSTMFCNMDDQSAFWPWSENHDV